MVTLVDSNVIFDFLTEDETWFEWSASMLQKSATDGTLAINPIIYAEIGSRYHTVEDLDTDLAAEYFTRAPLPWEAAFLAGKAFAQYKKRGGVKRSTLPDFYIGAHAAVTGMHLLTRDPKRYRTYFPKVRLVSP